MSGIFGIFDRNGKPVEEKTVNTLLDAVSYWDPDEKDTYMDAPIVLGHAMLWNTPESKYEHFPLKKDAYVLTMDARLDNREELLKELELPDRPLEEIGDSEFILAAYKKWEEACPKYLLGDFAFALWDERKEQLFCARDHIGIKPFYYYISDDLFVFSNDIRAIVSHPGISTKIDDRSIAMFLSERGFVEDKATFFDHIKKLPAANTLTVGKHTLAQETYWKIEDIEPMVYETYDAYVNQLYALMDNAVEVRLRTCYPVGSHLSGGLDSSSIAVLASRKLKKSASAFYAFNWIPIPDNKKDKYNREWGFSREIIDLEDIKHENTHLTAKIIEEMYENVDISTNDIMFFWEEYLVRDKAQKHNVRTILSGWGGDQLISYDGYAYLSGLIMKGRFIKAIRVIYHSIKDKKNRGLVTLKKFIKELIYPVLYKKMRGYYQVDKKKYDAFLYTKKDFTNYANTLPYGSSKFCSGVHNEQSYLYKEGYLLQRIESWASSGYKNKLEYAYPLLDKRIVEFALAIPEALYASKNGYTRLLFRDAIAELLPKSIIFSNKYADLEYDDDIFKIYEEFILLWFEKNKNMLESENDNYYIDRKKIIDRLKIYFADHTPNKNEGMGNILKSIILLNLNKTT